MTPQTKTILVVDDEAAIRRLAQRVLQRLGYKTLEAENGREGLALLTENREKIDVILLDLHLPDGSGTEWAEKFRDIQVDLPIIFFTGSNAPLDTVNAQGAKSYFLKKPFTPASVSDVFQEVFGTNT
jgi:two-component system, cell cycle sensor histidine kinase and response regulator CckA